MLKRFGIEKSELNSPLKSKYVNKPKPVKQYGSFDENESIANNKKKGHDDESYDERDSLIKKHL